MFDLPALDKWNTLYSTYKKIIQNSKVNYLELKRLRKNKSKIKPLLKKTRLNSSNLHEEYITNEVLNYLKHKYITGIRIEAKGRLSRSSGAAKSVYIFNHTGNIKNIDSSYKGLSSVLLRGYARSNVQYTKLKSKLPTGSFGLKGWVASN